MDKEQELEWSEAQKIVISAELVAAAKRHLQFLAAVDRHRGLYEGPILQRAIHRYNACWLPLLAKHSESQMSEGPLVVPLDCEWVWHCHRLNPVQYKSDCEQLYGRILDNYNVVSSVQETSIRHSEERWNRLYPEEPYSFDLTGVHSDGISKGLSESEKYTKYDLVSAVHRQSPFFYQVSRAHVNNDLFLEGAVARYKGFLHLIKRNRERSIKRFCVPTYDIDLMWHTHQLHPVSYCKDMKELIGKVLEHDDMDSDRTKGKKLDVGFSGTTKQWEDTFGSRYWKAGAMNRGNAPSPVTKTPFLSNIVSEKVTSSDSGKVIQVPGTKVVEVLLEVVGVRNLPEGHKGSLFVLFSKKEPDMFFDVKRRVSILSESGAKHVSSFQCEPTGELFFELISHSPSNLPLLKQSKTMGTLSISLSDFLCPVSQLSVEKWLDLAPISGSASFKPPSLRIAISFTVPTIAPYVLHMVRSRPFSKSSCFFPLPGRIQHARSWTSVIDDAGTEIISLQMRDLTKAKVRSNCILSKEVIGVMKSGETRTLAEFVGSGWSLMDAHCSLQLKKRSSEDGHLFELMGNNVVRLYPGRKLEFEAKHCERRRSDRDFLTAVEFSAENPYGKAVALLDLKCGLLKVNEDWLVLPGIVLAFILSDNLRKGGYDAFTVNEENLKLEDNLNQKVNGCHDDSEKTQPTTIVESEMQLMMEVAAVDAMTPAKASSCGGGCGSGCGSAIKSGGCGGCGSGCGGGCGSMVNSGGCGGCGSGCGGGCGNMVNSGGCGGCGSGCGGGCGNMVNSGGCGGCGGGCGNMVNSGGCGGCGGGCGNMVNSGGCGGCGGGCGNKVKSGGCGGCGGGGGCGNKVANESPISANEAAVA